MSNLAGEHRTAVAHTDQQLRVLLESTQRTRQYAEEAVKYCDAINFASGLYASRAVMVAADEAVMALIQAQEKVGALASALQAQTA